MEAAKAIVNADAPPSAKGKARPEIPDRVFTTETMAGSTPAQMPLKLGGAVTSIDAPPQSVLRITDKKYADYYAIVIESGAWRARPHYGRLLR